MRIILFLTAIGGLFLSACAQIQVESRPDVPSAVQLLSSLQEEKDNTRVSQLYAILEARDARFQRADFALMTRNNYIVAYGRLPNKEVIAILNDEVSRMHFHRSFKQLSVGSARTNLQRAADSDLHLKVASTLVSSYLDASVVKSSVFDGRVYLVGVLTPAQARFVKELVSKIRGVREVVSMFEYVKAPSYAQPENKFPKKTSTPTDTIGTSG